jgi:hypothetical protein
MKTRIFELDRNRCAELHTMCETFKETQQCPVKILYDSMFSVFLKSQVNFGILKYGNKEISPTDSKVHRGAMDQ